MLSTLNILITTTLIYCNFMIKKCLHKKFKFKFKFILDNNFHWYKKK